ncbi:MAG: sugar nucleotide-binding protein [Lautropia sp.]|nr:sugar nucleotide-binding protein [Lautropia sp.]
MIQTRQARHYRALPRCFRRPRLLIIGCGDIGQRTVRHLPHGWQIIGLAQHDDTLQSIRASGARALRADDHDSRHPTARPGRRHHTLPRRLAGWATHILHAAPPTSHDGDITDLLTRCWLRALAGARASRVTRRPARRLVYLSTTGVYGDRGGAWTAETDPPRPLTERARRRVNAEQQIRQAARTGLIAPIILRTPGIYAADRLPVTRLQQRIPALSAADDVVTNHIHADDLARIARTALLRGPHPRTINAVDDSQLHLGDYLDLVADRLGLPRPPRQSRASLQATLSPVRMSFMRESRRLHNRRLKQELRVALRWPTVQRFLARMPSPPNTAD